MKVVSSNIADIDHDGTDLFVEYLSGARYRFKNVPVEVFEAFKEAESKGRFMNSQIKGKYDFERLWT